MRNGWWCFLLVMLFATAAVVEGSKVMDSDNTTFQNIEDVPIAKWEELAGEKIYFGHQSVGFNIINGIREVVRDNPQIKLNIVETRQVNDFGHGIFAHSRIGLNEEHQSKIDDFVDLIGSETGNRYEYAFFKYCYVDAVAKTDIKQMFISYKSGINKIKKKHPDIVIIHFTIPLTVTKASWKTKVKKVFGKKIWEYEDNIKRNEFNTLLKHEFVGNEPVFDIASFESISPDGKESFFTVNGDKYFSMLPEYSDDGGHLNRKGSRIVAEQLLIFLANQLK